MSSKFKRVGVWGLVLALTFSISACGKLTEKAKVGTDGVSAVASASWQLLAGESELQKLYDTARADVSNIKLALAKEGGNKGYLLVEEVFPQEALKKVKNAYMEYANQSDKLAEATEKLSSYGITERELEQITPIIKGETLSEVQQQYLDQEIVLQNAMYAFTKDKALEAKITQFMDLNINGQKVQFAELVYKNTQSRPLKELDGYVQVGERYFVVIVWTNEAIYGENAEEYKKIIESLKIEPESRTLQSKNTSAEGTQSAGSPSDSATTAAP